MEREEDSSYDGQGEGLRPVMVGKEKGWVQLRWVGRRDKSPVTVEKKKEREIGSNYGEGGESCPVMAKQ